jgi:hypothetical protein
VTPTQKTGVQTLLEETKICIFCIFSRAIHN